MGTELVAPEEIRRALLKIARQVGRPTDEIQHYYGMERLLYRLSRSSYSTPTLDLSR